MPLSETAVLIARAKTGDLEAREQLMTRHLTLLRRWAHGRLPARARDLAETGDLIQMTVIRALSRLDHFESRREGAFLAYLRQIFMNLLRNEIRRSANATKEPIVDDLAEEPAPPLERMLGRELLDTYEAALETLPEVMREAIIMKLEFGFSHKEIAAAIGSPSPDAARMMLSRALVRMTEQMQGRR